VTTYNVITKTSRYYSDGFPLSIPVQSLNDDKSFLRIPTISQLYQVILYYGATLNDNVSRFEVRGVDQKDRNRCKVSVRQGRWCGKGSI
jgi:hypothetical protein